MNCCHKIYRELINIQNHKKTFVVGIVLILLGLFYFLWWSKVQNVPAYSVQKQDYVPSLLLSGEVIPESSMQLSAQATSTV